MKLHTWLSRRSYLKLLASGSLAGLAAACSGSSGPAASPGPGATRPPEVAQPAKKPEAQQLTVGYATIPRHFDTHRDTSAIHVLGYTAVFDALTSFNPKGELQPQLASSWRIVNPTTWEFKLRTGVKFQNGEPFDAETVKWNVERLVDPKFVPSVRTQQALLIGARVIDSHTVELITSGPDPLFPRRLGTFFLIPPGYHTQVGEQAFLQKPSGTGPWRVRSFQKDERIVLEAVGGSWRGMPKLAEITMVEIPESSGRLAALRTGEIDIAGFLPTDQAETARQSGLSVKSTIVQRVHIVALSTTQDTPLKDKRVRQAFNYAVDKEGLVRNIMRGYAKISEGQLVGPDGFGYNPTLRAYPYDPAKAKQLLTEAGFPNGFSINMHSTNAAYINDKETAEAIVGYLANLGVQVKLEFNESADQIAKRRAGKLHPMYLHAYNYFPVGDADFTLGWWDSKKTATKVPTFDNPDFDKAYWSSQTETDSDKRLSLLQRASEILYDDPPVIFLFQPADVYGLRQNVQNFDPRADSRVHWDILDKSS